MGTIVDTSKNKYGMLLLKQLLRRSLQPKKTFYAYEPKRMISSHTVKVNDVTLHFETTGTGQKPLLLLPGALGSSRTDFTQQLQHMNGSDFTLVAWDPRGYGQSRPPRRDWPLHFLGRDADDAAALMESLGYSHYSLLGWSDGG